jgi:hypothetical protein
MPSAAPKGYKSFYIEISCRPGIKLNSAKMLKKIKEDLIEAGILKNGRIKVSEWLYMPYAYVIYDKNRVKAVDKILSFLKNNDIHSIGRYGAWKYSFMEESILNSKELAGKL